MKCNWRTYDEVQLSTLPGYLTDSTLAVIGTSAARNGRIGDEILAQSMHVKGMMRNNSANTVYCRVLAFWTPERAISATSELFQIGATAYSTLTAVTGLNQIYTPLNKNKYKFLVDKTFRINSTAETGEVFKLNIFKKLGGKKIMFEHNTSGDENQNHVLNVVYMVARADDDTGLGEDIEMSLITRFWYTDP